MAFERFSPAASQPAAPYMSSSPWEGMTFSTFSGYSPTMESGGNTAFAYAPPSSPEVASYSYYSSNSEQSTPSPSMISASPSPSVSEPITPVWSKKSVSSQKGSRIKDEELTPKQLKRRLQNRVSQQAVRRRRNSPARILETRLQELDREHNDLMKFYTSNIESCIQTLTTEIKTLRELQGLLERGTAVPAKFDAILASDLFSAGRNLAAGGGGVDQNAAYQNHDFDSSVMGAHY